MVRLTKLISTKIVNIWVFVTSKQDDKHFEMVSGDYNCHQGSVGVCFVGLHEACATLSLWLGWMQLYYGTWPLILITQSSIIRCTGGVLFLKAVPHRSKTKTVSRDCNCHQGSVGVCFMGLLEACTTLSLWPGWTQSYYSTWTLMLITQSLIIRHIGGIVFLKAVPHPCEGTAAITHGIFQDISLGKSLNQLPSVYNDITVGESTIFYNSILGLGVWAKVVLTVFLLDWREIRYKRWPIKKHHQVRPVEWNFKLLV